MTPSTTQRVSVVFDDRASAERAIAELRSRGITDKHISVVARSGDDTTVSGSGTAAESSHDASDAGKRAGKGALAGAGVGALFGLGALAIPGIGPFIAAGWLAEALGVTGGMLASGAIVGGTSGALAGLFAKAGYDKDEARYFGESVEEGGIFVAVDTTNSPLPADEVRGILNRHDARLYSRGSGARSDYRDSPPA